MNIPKLFIEVIEPNLTYFSEPLNWFTILEHTLTPEIYKLRFTANVVGKGGIRIRFIRARSLLWDKIMPFETAGQKSKHLNELITFGLRTDVSIILEMRSSQGISSLLYPKLLLYTKRETYLSPFTGKIS